MRRSRSGLSRITKRTHALATALTYGWVTIIGAISAAASVAALIPAQAGDPG
jgi:hypothetical protein